jgi:penicillin-binding protein 2
VERYGRLSTPRGVRLRRSTAARGVLFLILTVLLGAAAKLQVLEVNEYALAAKNNRLRPLMVHSPRGTIYDRHGQVIAENVPAYQVMIMPGKRDSMNAQIERLKPVLQLDSAGIRRAWRKWEMAKHLPMIILSDAPLDAIARLEERRREFPGVLVFEYAKRRYPVGDVVAHFIGYVAEINEKQLESEEFTGYEQGRWIGQQGLERQYEKYLGGQPGMRYLEIDAMGRIKRWLPEELGVPPIPGKDLQLHLDLDLQRYVQGIFPKGYRGAFVALDPKTGGVLAYYSHPSYDPNLFTGGIATSVYDSLMKDPAKPLFDRVAGSTQPPASTWKLPLAALALEEKVITPEEFMPIACSGGMSYQGRYARCWEPAGHGRVDLIRGIMYSCDVYFYQVGIRLHLKRYIEAGTRLGFQKRTGIDLPTEVKNLFPEDLGYWKRHFGYGPPADNEVMSMAIGQGPVTMTPLKMTHLFAALINPDGKAKAPRMAMTGEEVPVTFDFHITPDNAEMLKKGMRRVLGPGGTAPLSRLAFWDFGGKTGTAQACANCGLKDHAWFIGWGAKPGEYPEIVAGMFMQHGEHGYLPSGFVANAVNFYLDRKYGRRFERYPTPRDRYPRNLPVSSFFQTPIVDPIPGVGYPNQPAPRRQTPRRTTPAPATPAPATTAPAPDTSTRPAVSEPAVQ